MHVSTTYSNTNHPIIEEKVYPATADWKQMIELSESLSEDELAKQAPQHMGYHPNTYTFTKSLAEQVINDHRDRLNVSIYRPSIGEKDIRRCQWPASIPLTYFCAAWGVELALCSRWVASLPGAADGDAAAPVCSGVGNLHVLLMVGPVGGDPLAYFPK